MLISGIFFLIQALPKLVQWTAKILPLHNQVLASKQTLLFGLQASTTWIYLAIPLLILTYYLIRKN